jgi:PTS system ascorbate-specific IIC component
MEIINFIATNIIGNPGILFGIITLVGMLLLKKSFPDILMGVVKTIIGYLILVLGCGPLQSACTPVGAWVNSLLGVQGVIPQNWIIMSTATSQFGSQVGLTVLVGFIVNLLLARFTKLKNIALTGQILVIWASFSVGIIVANPDVSFLSVVLFGGVFCGVYNWLASAVSYHFMKKSGRMSDEWSLYVTEITGIVLTSWLAPIVGNKDKRCDDIEVPESLEWLRDTTVSVSIIATIIWMIVGVIAGPARVSEFSGGQNWFIYLLFLGLNFGMGLTVVLFGVRMMLAEIVPAFKGISTRLIKDAIPGLDYPTVFQFAPMAVFIGFLSNLAGGILATFVMTFTNMPVVILPAVWMNFWTGGMLGVFADAYGGRRGCIIMTLLLGFIVPFGWALAYPTSGIFVASNATADYTDTATIGYLYQIIVNSVFSR